MRNNYDICKLAVSLYKDNIRYCSNSIQKVLNYKFMSYLFDKNVSLAYMRLAIGQLNCPCDLLIEIFSHLPVINKKILYKCYEELIDEKYKLWFYKYI